VKAKEWRRLQRVKVTPRKERQMPRKAGKLGV